MGKIKKGRDRTPFPAPAKRTAKQPPFYKAGKDQPQEEPEPDLEDPEQKDHGRDRVVVKRREPTRREPSRQKHRVVIDRSRQSLYDLVLSTRRYDPKRVERTPYIDIEIKNVIPYFGTSSILFTANSLSGTSPAIKYPTVIAFYNIQFIDGEENWKRGMLKFENPSTHETVVCEQPDYRRSPVRVYCACPDFYFSFAYPDFHKQCYYGRKPKPYKRVMPPSNYPPRNPNNIPGVCKHVLNMVNILIKQGYVR